MPLTDLQVYNLAAGLVVVLAFFGGLGIYTLRQANAEARSQDERSRR